MSTTIAPPEFSDSDDGWSEAPVPDVGLQLRPTETEDQGDPDDDPAGGAVAPVDPEAPWGRFKNGKAKKKPRSSRAPARRIPAAPRRTTAAARKPAAAKDRPDYHQMSVDLIQEGTALGGVAATLLKSTAIAADVVMFDLQTDNIARVSADFAADEPRWAGVLERVTSVSKWGGPATLAISMLAQVCVNHGMLPPGIMGTREPGVLLDLAEKRAKKLQEEADRAAVRAAA